MSYIYKHARKTIACASRTDIGNSRALRVPREIERDRNNRGRRRKSTDEKHVSLYESSACFLVFLRHFLQDEWLFHFLFLLLYNPRYALVDLSNSEFNRMPIQAHKCYGSLFFNHFEIRVCSSFDQGKYCSWQLKQSLSFTKVFLVSYILILNDTLLPLQVKSRVKLDCFLGSSHLLLAQIVISESINNSFDLGQRYKNNFIQIAFMRDEYFFFSILVIYVGKTWAIMTDAIKKWRTTIARSPGIPDSYKTRFVGRSVFYCSFFFIADENRRTATILLERCINTMKIKRTTNRPRSFYRCVCFEMRCKGHGNVPIYVYWPHTLHTLSCLPYLLTRDHQLTFLSNCLRMPLSFDMKI